MAFGGVFSIPLVVTHAPNMNPRPQVGVAVLVLDGNGKVIMGQRQGSHGAGKQLPCPPDFV